MNPSLLRTIQVGVALIVLTAVTVATLVILDLMSRDAALQIGLNVSAIIAICMVAGMVLTAVFGIGNRRDEP